MRSTSPWTPGDRAAERARRRASATLTSTDAGSRRRLRVRGAPRSRSTLGRDLVDHRLARARPAAASRARSRRRRPRSTLAPASRASSSRCADAPPLQPVELDRQRVVDLVGVVADADPEPLAQERAHRVLGRSARGRRARPAASARGGSGPARNGAARRAVGVERPRAVERDAVEAPRRSGTSSPAVKLRGSNGCSGWRTTTVARGRRPDRAVDHVEQLADRHRGRPRRGSCARRCRCR